MKRSKHSISWMWPIVFLIGGCVLFYLIHLLDYLLPRVISINEARENPELFSGERSRVSLRKLTNLGPRIVGDIANEVYAPKIIEDDVLEAQSNANSAQKILVERQKGSGAYFLETKLSYINIYNDVQNVLVLLEGSEGNHSILVNCHYDSVPGSEGASDDVLSCAIMLELIRVLSVSPKRLKHNVVFLFNGAEETGLDASHLFLQHKWAEKCRVVLNLEAAGQGGRPMLFQSGPKHPWIFNYYLNNAPHLHGQVWMEELFQKGFIPSDTDFRIFRDFGGMIGLDFAFGRNGYVYHTQYDTEEYIPVGSHQYLGENILGMLRKLGYADEFYNMADNADGEMVYYDYLGWFMIAYSVEGGIAINVISIVLSIISVVFFIGRLLEWSWLPGSVNCCRKKSEVNDLYGITENTEGIEDRSNKPNRIKPSRHTQLSFRAIVTELCIAFFGRILSTVLAVGITAAVAAIINSAATLVMPWYSNVWLIFPIYWCPTLIFYALIPYLFDIWRSEKRKGTLASTGQLNLIVAQIPWTILILGLTCAGVRSSCLFVFPVMSSAIANIIIHFTPLCKTVNKWIWAYLFIHIPSFVFTMYVTMIVYIVLLPISARSGVINSDLYVGVVTALATLYITSFIIPLMSLVRKQWVVYIFLALFSIIFIILALCTPVGLPYRKGPNNPTPQRYWIMHSDREYYNQSGSLRNRLTGYFVLNLDPNSPRTIPLKTRMIRSMETDCDEELYCGLPFYKTRMIPLSTDSSWISAPAPIQPNPIELSVKKSCFPSLNICQMDFSLQGPDRLTVTFSPREGVSLLSWNLPASIQTTGEWKGRPFYYLHIIRGDITNGDFDLQLRFNMTMEQLNGSPFLDIALAGNHAHHDKYRTEEFQNFLDSFPDWTDIFGWISAIKLYTF